MIVVAALLSDAPIVQLPSLSDSPTQLATDDAIELEGTVKAVHPGGRFRVTTSQGQNILAYPSEKMKGTQIIKNDRVLVRLNRKTAKRGIIIAKLSSG